MKCKDCYYFNSDYHPNRCSQDRNVIYHKEGGASYKETALEINPQDYCLLGKDKNTLKPPTEEK